MKPQIELKHLAILKGIFNHRVGDLYVFGSRAKGSAKALSDLDLVIKCDVDKKVLSQIREQLEQSNLPYKVDLVLWKDLSQSFQSNIEADLIPLEI